MYSQENKFWREPAVTNLSTFALEVHICTLPNVAVFLLIFNQNKNLKIMQPVVWCCREEMGKLQLTQLEPKYCRSSRWNTCMFTMWSASWRGGQAFHPGIHDNSITGRFLASWLFGPCGCFSWHNNHSRLDFWDMLQAEVCTVWRQTMCLCHYPALAGSRFAEARVRTRRSISMAGGEVQMEQMELGLRTGTWKEWEGIFLGCKHTTRHGPQ